MVLLYLGKQPMFTHTFPNPYDKLPIQGPWTCWNISCSLLASLQHVSFSYDYSISLSQKGLIRCLIHLHLLPKRAPKPSASEWDTIDGAKLLQSFKVHMEPLIDTTHNIDTTHDQYACTHSHITPCFQIANTTPHLPLRCFISVVRMYQKLYKYVVSVRKFDHLRWKKRYLTSPGQRLASTGSKPLPLHSFTRSSLHRRPSGWLLMLWKKVSKCFPRFISIIPLENEPKATARVSVPLKTDKPIAYTSQTIYN